MEIKNIIIASAVVAIVGLIIAILLSVAEKIFHVEVDEKEIKIRQALAGNNCGACGYAGCDALAKAIAKGEAPIKPAHLQVSQVLIKLLKLWVHKPVIM